MIQLFLLLTLTVSANMLINSGFEDISENGEIPNWYLSEGVSSDTTNVHSESKSIKMIASKEQRRAGQAITIEPGYIYDKSKTIEQIFYQDFKMFNVGEISFGVGQINLFGYDEEDNLKERIYEYMVGENDRMKTDMMFFMVTNVIEKSSTVVFCGKNAYAHLERLFHKPETESTIYLENFVSRKKQFVPFMLDSFHAEVY